MVRMRFAFYDPVPWCNDYVSRMFFRPLREYAASKGILIEESSHLVPTKGRGMICNADHLTADTILHFKDNGCPLFAFSCIDSAWLSEALRFNPLAPLIDKIFMVTGVQTTNFSNATVFDPDFKVGTEKRSFLPEGDWNVFEFMRERGILHALPYVQWSRHAPPTRLSFSQRRPTALFRGGHHFLRVLAYLFALQRGFADPASGFLVKDYFRDDMNPAFRYCQECRQSFRSNGGRYPYGINSRECASPAPWGNGLDLSSPNRWNNRCPESFYWLSRKLEEAHGSIDRAALESAMNFTPETEEEHLATVGKMRFYADCKWEFSIHSAQRFWEAASVGTINLIPRRANDQDYFPYMRDGEHYLTFADDFADFSAEISQEQFEHISNKAFDLWSHWMRPTEDYALSPNLCAHIFKEMGHQ